MLKETLCAQMQLPRAYVDEIQRSASHRYKVFFIEKKRGGLREIHHPAPELKAIQRWLLRSVIDRLPVHTAAFAYRPGRGIAANARMHAGGDYLLRLDFAGFFPSLTREDVARLLSHERAITALWTQDDFDFFCDIVCRRNRLTIGAPTSPGLSNCLCFELDVRLTEYCRSREITYTRYADDLTFSSRRRHALSKVPRFVRKTLDDLNFPKGLRLNFRKTANLSRRNRRVVTGLVLTSTREVSLGRAAKRALRTRLHLHSLATPVERKALAGMLAYALSVEPEFINRLVLKYGADEVRSAMRPEQAGLGLIHREGVSETPMTRD